MKTRRVPHRLIFAQAALICFFLLTASRALAADDQLLPNTIDKIKPAIIAVGTFQKIRRPPGIFRGTGFVIGDGSLVATNLHVLPDKLDSDKREYLAVFTTKTGAVDIREATKIAEDRDHDLTILRITGQPLPALTLGDSKQVREGQSYAFTGFPIGMVLGLHPATHRAMISAITPIAIPQLSAQQIDKRVLSKLTLPYDVFQLDATAYPGNSGSPLFDPASGRVIGILNKVFIQETKETIIEKPSGISYAIPIDYLKDLLNKSGGAR